MILRHRLEYGALAALSFLLKAVPRPAALAVGGLIGWIGWTLRVRRELVLANIAQALPASSPREREQIAARAARNFGRTIVEFVRFGGRDRLRTHELVSVGGSEDLQAALGEGRGAIVVTGHLGAWALYFAALALQGIPTVLLVGRQKNPGVNAMIQALGERLELVPHGRSAPRTLLKHLAAGKTVVMVADQHSGPRGTSAPFFGRATSTLSLPGALVAKRDLPLFAMTGHRRNDGRHELSLRRIAVPPGQGEREPVRRRQIATLCNQAISDAVLEHPDQYFWYHRRFRPAGDPREPPHPTDDAG